MTRISYPVCFLARLNGKDFALGIAVITLLEEWK